MSSCPITNSYRNAKEIQVKDDGVATPMSVLDPTTPMSIDKSCVDIEQANKSAIRNDRERFFEAIEYQKDILKYLKQLEVRNFFLLNLVL